MLDHTHMATYINVYTHTAAADEWAAQRPAHTNTHQMMGIALLGYEHTQLLGYRLILC